jgi:DNA-binding NarL/FixJ family response regulator
MSALRLLIADDHEIVRKGLCTILQLQAGWEVVGEAGDGSETVEKATILKPDVVIMDISMPVLDGIQATRQLRKNVPEAKVLILTMHESDLLVSELLDAGARGYLVKSDVGADLIKAVHAVGQNKTFFTSSVAKMMLDGYFLKPHKEPETATRLTPRQRQILNLLAEGKTSKEVAAASGITIKTAETHRANIMIRLNCHSIAELVRYAVRNQIVSA